MIDINTWFPLLVTMFLGIVGILYSVHCFKDEMRIKLFSDYTKRYQEIMLNLPAEALASDFDLRDLPKDDFNDAIKYYRAYFDLCSEEYFLWQNKQISPKTWDEWYQGMQYAFSRKPVSTAWELISLDSHYYPEFRALVKEFSIAE